MARTRDTAVDRNEFGEESGVEGRSSAFADEAAAMAASAGPQVDAVWDRGSLVAIEPGLRPQYAALLAGRLAPGGKILIMALSYDTAAAGSMLPPHSVSMDELKALYEPHGMTVSLLHSEEAIATAPPHLREKISTMREALFEVSKPT